MVQTPPDSTTPAACRSRQSPAQTVPGLDHPGGVIRVRRCVLTMDREVNVQGRGAMADLIAIGFQNQVRNMVQPGTSALFLMLEKVTPDKAVEAMSKYGGTVLKTSLSKDDDKELQDALHGSQPTAQ